MLDPFSTQFKHVYIVEMGQPSEALCGYMITKNEFGVYTGWQPFVTLAGPSDNIVNR